jgi:hypothetical protein
MTHDINDDFIVYLDGEEVSRTDLKRIKPWDNATGDRDKEYRTRYLGGKWGEGKGNTSGGTFLGKIDDVRMWNVVRTQEQIKETIKSRNQPKTGNEPGYQNLVAYYPMDLNDDWELIDLSPRKNNVKIGRYGPLSRANISSGKFTGDFIINEEIRPRYFSDDCPDGPDGSLTCPYPTIRSAMDDLHKRIKNGQYGGYHLYVREGRYTEVLNKWHLNRDNQMDMSKVRPIVFEGYPNEKVIIDGTVALNSNWQQASHLFDNGTSISIYKTVVDFDNISKEIRTPISSIYQLFVNDRYMIPAMPMNFKNPTDPTTGNPKNPEPNTIWSLSQRTEEEAIVQVEDEGTIDEENIDNSTLYDNATWELVDLSPRGNNVKLGRYGAMSRADRNTGKFDIDNDSTRSMVSGRNSFIINEEIRPRYFSDDCPDGPDGSLTCPFPTIRSAMDNLYKRIKNGQYGGYHLYIREGRYTEVLNK